MADENWKNRVGIDINCYSEDEEAYTSTEDNKPFNDDDDHLSDAEQYSKTPPRTKILRRSRERKQRMTVSNIVKITNKSSSTKFSRRNTISNVYMNVLMANDDSGDSDHGVTYDKRTSKRSLKLLRGSERDLKLDISRASARVGYNSNNDIYDERAESLPIKTPTSIQIETSNRFLSLISRPVLSFDKNNTLNYPEPEGCPKNRVDFYKTFSLLIRMGYKENSTQDRQCRRHISQEEQLWQNELKDLIWLQLQAWHADRTVTEQDQYLCKARNSIPELLDEIVNYRYTVRASTNCSVADTDETDAEWPYRGQCYGCLSMVCIPCLKSQNEALFQIEQLLARLETAEALYPSSKSFGQHYPLYNSEQFVARVKAMCLWYNLTKHLRIKLLILGKFLMFLKNKDYVGPVNGFDESTSTSRECPEKSSSTDDSSNTQHSEKLSS